MKGLTILRHNQYTRVLLIQASRHPRCGTRFGESRKNEALLSIEDVFQWITTGVGYVAKPHMYLDVLFTLSDKHRNQSIQWDIVHPSLRGQDVEVEPDLAKT